MSNVLKFQKSMLSSDNIHADAADRGVRQEFVERRCRRARFDGSTGTSDFSDSATFATSAALAAPSLGPLLGRGWVGAPSTGKRHFVISSDCNMKMGHILHITLSSVILSFRQGSQLSRPYRDNIARRRQ